jgi:TolA-binding protein
MKNRHNINRSHRISLALLLLGLVLNGSGLHAQHPENTKVTTGQALHPDSVQVRVNPDSIGPATETVVEFIEEIGDEKSLDSAIEQNENLLLKFPDDPFISSAMFQLSELYVRKARHVYGREMGEYEKNYKLFEQGQGAPEPILPTMRLGKAIEMCYDILERFPRNNFKDRVLYRLAICHLDEGNREKAQKYFTDLIFEFPKSSFVAEAHFRIGEYFFGKRNFPEAIKHYAELLQSWDNPYFNMALYKLGWSYYNIEDYVSSITTFVYLLGDIRLLEQADTKILGKTNSDLRKESIDYVAICFTEYGGPLEAKRFLIDKKKGNEDYNLHVFLKIGDIYQKRNFYEDEILNYKTILDIWPFYQYAPVIQQKIVDAYESDLQPEKAMEERVLLVERYGPGSKWLNQYPEGQIRNDAIVQAEKALYDYATYYQAVAQEKKRKREYLVAIEKYRDFLKKFPRAKQAAEVNFYLAECLYEVEEYDEAAAEYSKVLSNYGPSEHQDAAAYNRILAYYNILEKSPATDTLTFYLEDFLGNQSIQPDPIKVGNKIQKDLLRACNDFVIMLPKSDRLEEVLVKFGETLYNLKQYVLAARIYQKIITDFTGGKYYADAYSLLAQAYFQAGNFDEAAKTSEAIISNFKDSSNMVNKAQKLVASSGFKRAENFGKQNEPLKAADSFVQVAYTTSDPEIAKVAIFRAAVQYDSLGDYKKATQVLEKMVAQRNDIDFAPELYFKAASLHEREGVWNWAVIDYMKIVDNYPKSILAPKAHFRAGECYENQQKWQLAETTFKLLLDANYEKSDPDDLLLALYKIGEIRYNQKNLPGAEEAFQNTVRKYIELKKEMKPADEYLPAKAQYFLGEISNEEFQQITIQEPFETTIPMKKNLFNKTLRNYSNAIKFSIAEWATASYFKIGHLYEEYAAVLVQIPLGAELSPEQIEEHRSKIRRELGAEALKYYRTNVTQAEKASIQNEWVDKSRERMQKLILELRLGSADAPTEVKKSSANNLNE